MSESPRCVACKHKEHRGAECQEPECSCRSITHESLFADLMRFVCEGGTLDPYRRKAVQP